MKTQTSLFQKRFFLMLALVLVLICCLSCQKFNETTLYKNANELYNDEDYKGAIVKYEELAKGQFFQKEASLHLGYCYLSLVRSSLTEEEVENFSGKAIAAFQKYLQINPSDEKIEDYIFNTYMDSRDYDKVLKFLYEKYEKDPQDIRAIQLIIQSYEDQGKIPEAIEWYKKRCEIAPEDPNAYYAFAVFFWRNSYYNQRLDAALRATFVNEGVELVMKAAELNPEFADAHTYWNLLLREKAKYTKSKRKQEKIMEEANEHRDIGRELRMAQQEREKTEGGKDGQEGMAEETTDGEASSSEEAVDGEASSSEEAVDGEASSSEEEADGNNQPSLDNESDQ